MKERLAPLCYAIISIFIFFSLISCADKYVAEVESYIKSDVSVQRTLGEIKSLSRSNTIIVNAGNQTQVYREYQFIVRGSRSKALVSVQMRNFDNPSKRHLLIKSIDEL